MKDLILENKNNLTFFKTQMLVRVQSNRNFHSLLVGMWNQ